MPVYEYECQRCGDRIEEIQKVGEKLSKHAGCGGRLKRLLSAPAIQFKGTGWYVTDYARKSGGDDAKKDSEAKADAGAETKAESKSDSKSDKKTETKAAESKTSKSDKS